MLIHLTLIIPINKMNTKKITIKTGLLICSFAVMTSQAIAQSVEQIRWKSTEQVREVLGEPGNMTSPVGTHASYVLWSYEDFTVAFANGKAFHLFKTATLNEINLNEQSPEN